MSSDLIFWICAAALLLLLEVCLYIGLRSSSRNEVENTSLNRLVYQDQFQTLNQELAGHRISKAVYDAELSELEARAVEETEAPLVNYRKPSMDKASFYFPPCSDSFYSCFALFLLGKSFSCDLQRNTGSAGCSSARRPHRTAQNLP